jgi:hypothetical protein
MKHARDDYQRIQDPEGKIPDDEPVFLMRGQDRTAWVVVIVWAVFNFAIGGDWRLVWLAWRHAQAMRRWSKKKTADAAPGSEASA